MPLGQAKDRHRLADAASLSVLILQPAKLPSALLRTRLEWPADVLALFGLALKQGTAALIAFAVVQEPEAYLALARTMLAGGIRTPDVWRAFIHHHLAVELCLAVRAWDGFTFGRVIKLYVEEIIGHIISPKDMPECTKNDSGTLCIQVEQENPSEYKKETTMSEFLTIKEVGLFLRLSAQSVKRLIREGRLTAHRIGKCSYRIPEEAVKVLLVQTLAGPIGDAFEGVLNVNNEEKAK